MKRESTENRADCIVSRRRVNPIFPVPPTCATICISLSFSLFLYQYFACLPRVSAFKNLTTGGSRYIRTGFHIRKVLGFWPRTIPPFLVPSSGDRSRLKAILYGPGTSRFGLLFDQSWSCTHQLYSISYFDSGGHVTPQNFAVGFAPLRYASIHSFYLLNIHFYFISWAHSLFFLFQKFYLRNNEHIKFL